MQNSEYYYSKIVIEPSTSSLSSRSLNQNQNQKQNTNNTLVHSNARKTSSPYKKGAFDNTAPRPPHRLHFRESDATPLAKLIQTHF